MVSAGQNILSLAVVMRYSVGRFTMGNKEKQCKDCRFHYYAKGQPGSVTANYGSTPARSECVIDPHPVYRGRGYPVCERFKEKESANGN